MSPESRSWLLDASERVLWTAVQSGLGAAIAVLSTPADVGHGAVAAVAATVLAALKTWVARKVGPPDARLGLRG